VVVVQVREQKEEAENFRQKLQEVVSAPCVGAGRRGETDAWALM
jgi:uncharacterized phage protein gp47/JayE